MKIKYTDQRTFEESFIEVDDFQNRIANELKESFIPDKNVVVTDVLVTKEGKLVFGISRREELCAESDKYRIIIEKI